MIQGNQVSVLSVKDATGKRGRIALQELFNQKVQGRTADIAFTTTAVASIAILSTAMATIFSNGANEANGLAGGICASTSGDGSFSNVFVDYANNGNLVEVISQDVNMDETQVFAFVSTSVANGGAVDADTIQLNFVTKGEDGTFTEFNLPVGSHVVSLNLNYTVASAVSLNVLGKVLSNGNGNVDGFSEEEIKNILGSMEHEFASFAINSETDLGDSKILNLGFVSNTVDLKLGDGTAVDATLEASAVIVPPKTVVQGIAGTASKSDISVYLNGILVRPSRTNITAVNTITIDLTDELFGTILYDGDTISILGL